METLSGWLLVYVLGSVPLLIFYSAGLAGWYYDYPLNLFAGILAMLMVPLAMLVLKVPGAVTLNVALVWVAAGLISLRIVSAVWAKGGDGHMRRVRVGNRVDLVLSEF